MPPLLDVLNKNRPVGNTIDEYIEIIKKECGRTLTISDVKRTRKWFILTDFMKWSGGFTPDEMDDKEAEVYITTAMPANVDEDEIRHLISLIP